jgi:hypothetical protein
MSTLTVRAEPPEPAAGLTPTFWQRPVVQDVLPFLTSLLLHVSLIAVGILTYKAAEILVAKSQTPLVIPDAASVEDAERSLLPASQFHGVGDLKMPNFQDADPAAAADAKGLSDKAAMLQTLSPAGGGAGSTDDAEIALGLDKNFGRGNRGTGPSDGDGLGSGIGDGPGLTRFGPRSAGGGTPTFRGNAPKVVFLCDSSGSMLPKFDALRTELRRAIDALRPNQQFDVIFFSADRYIALDASLLYALPENKRKAYDFLDKVAPHDSSDPIPGLNAAFKTEPELIFMLTDGDFPNNAAVLAEVRKLNAAKPVKINTIAFMDRGETYEQLLSDIAKDTGGLFRFVSEEDLNANR